MEFIRKRNKTCIVIPTYNNAGTVGQVIEDVQKYCKDIIVVNDGCTDDTSSILNSFGDAIDVIEYGRNKGKGYALIQGFNRAKAKGYTHVITIDADGQHFASDIPCLTKAMKDNPNGIIVGCRNLTEENMPRQNTFANKFSNFWFRLQTGVNLPDTQSGFRLYTLSSLTWLKLITSRYESELELMVFASWNGVNITSTSVRVYYPPAEERVSHFRPVYDFIRISVLNTILCIGTVVYGVPRRLIRNFRRLHS